MTCGSFGSSASSLFMLLLFLIYMSPCLVLDQSHWRCSGLPRDSHCTSRDPWWQEIVYSHSWSVTEIWGRCFFFGCVKLKRIDRLRLCVGWWLQWKLKRHDRRAVSAVQHARGSQTELLQESFHRRHFNHGRSRGTMFVYRQFLITFLHNLTVAVLDPHLAAFRYVMYFRFCG